MLDERLLYVEILKAIKKRAGERLQVHEGEEEISFYPESLIGGLSPEIKRYEQSIRDTLSKMVQKEVLNQGGSPLEYSTTKNFNREYERFCNQEIA